MARALVLGATGHIGSHIVRALLAGGHDVRASYRQPRYLSVLDGLSIERVPIDLNEPDQIRRALTGCDWVFYAAGYYPGFRESCESAMARGVAAARTVLQCCAEAKLQRIVFTSSAATIRRVPGRAATEMDHESWPIDGRRPVYTMVKLAMEQEALRAAAEGLPVVIVNPSVCLGEYDAHAFSGRAILVFAKHPLPFYLTHTFNVIYTGDVGIGHVRAAERGRIGERYLLAAHNITIKDFAAVVARLAGVTPPRVCVPYPVARAAAYASEAFAWLTRTEPLLPRQVVASARVIQVLDASKAVAELGLPQTPIEEAVERALSWFRAHGFL